VADLDKAVMFVLGQEDSKMQGVITNDPRDSGGRTRYGVAERFHPELTSTGFFDTMTAAEALDKAKEIYEAQYAAPVQLSNMVSQDVANAALSFAVNEGTGTFVKLLQEAIGVEEDGIMGPQTMDKLNSCNPYTLLQSLQVVEQQYYMGIVEAKPDQSVFLKGWLNRVYQDCLIKQE
jgi:lysozyme family protein